MASIAQLPAVLGMSPEGEPPPRKRWGRWVLLGAGALGCVGLVAGEVSGFEVLSGCSSVLLGLAVFATIGWVLRVVVRKLLWGVGRRLLVSYLLLGVLPLPFLFGFVWVSSWMMSGQLAARRVETAWQAELSSLQRAAEAAVRGGEVAGDVELVRIDPDLVPLPVRMEGDEEDEGDDATEVETEGQTETEEEPAPEDQQRPLAERVALALGDSDLPGEGILRTGDDFLLYARVDDRIVWRLLEPTVRQRIQDATGAGVAFPQSAVVKTNATSVELGITMNDSEDKIDGSTLFEDVSSRDLGFFAKEIVYWARSAGVTYLRDRETEVEVRDDPFVLLVRTSIEREVDELFTGGLEDDMNSEIAEALPVILASLTGMTLTVYLLASLLAGILVLRVARAASRLDRGFRALEAGDFSARVSLKGRDQLAALAAGFNRMAGHLDVALAERAEQEATQRELQVARDLQKSLLPPQEAELGGLFIAANVEPAAAVGGDFFHLHEDVGNRLVVGVGDVSGHGLPTGIVMAATRALVSAIADSGRMSGTDAPELMKTLDRELRRMTNRRTFVTLVVCRFDLVLGKIEVTNAGHLPPWRVRRDGDVRAIEGSTRPLGVGPPTQYQTVEGDLAPGDRWVLISDGFVEAVDPSGELFGFERFEDLLRTVPPLDACGTRDFLVERWEEWTGTKQPEDDRTICVIEVPERGELAGS